MLSVDREEILAWLKQTKSAALLTVQGLLAEVDEIKRESDHEHSQLKQLAEERRGLQSQLLQMVSKTELSAAMEELARERQSKSALRERFLEQQHENKALVTAMQVSIYSSLHGPRIHH